MKIRKARREDAGVIAAYNRALAEETEDLQLDAATVMAGVTALIEDEAKGIYFVADEGGEVVGQLCITYEWSDWRNGNFWWIQSVFVKQEFRGKGVFKALFEHLEGLLREQKNVCGVRLYMEKDNDRARRAYEKLGLRQTYYQVFEKGPGE